MVLATHRRLAPWVPGWPRGGAGQAVYRLAHHPSNKGLGSIQQGFVKSTRAFSAIGQSSQFLFEKYHIPC